MKMRAEYFTAEMRDAAIAKAGLTRDSVVADVGKAPDRDLEGLAPLAERSTGSMNRRRC